MAQGQEGAARRLAAELGSIPSPEPYLDVDLRYAVLPPYSHTSPGGAATAWGQDEAPAFSF